MFGIMQIYKQMFEMFNRRNKGMKSIRSERITMKRVLILAAIVCTVLFAITFLQLRKNKAYGSSDRVKTCVSIQIREGDTLWDIASAYYTPECGSLQAYIKEIKRTNSLKSDSIHAGHYLLIPYYCKTE